jgi:hypothetical protein
MSIYLPRFCTSRFRDIAWEFCTFTNEGKNEKAARCRPERRLSAHAAD